MRLPTSKREQKAVMTVYAQQNRYFKSENIMKCPRTLFKIQLVEQIKEWIDKGDEIILFMDGNEPIPFGCLSKMLKNIGLSESYSQRHEKMDWLCGTGVETNRWHMVLKRHLHCRDTIPPIPIWFRIPQSNHYGYPHKKIQY